MTIRTEIPVNETGLQIQDIREYAHGLPEDYGSFNWRKILVVNELCPHLSIGQKADLIELSRQTYYTTMKKAKFTDTAIKFVRETLGVQVQDVKKAFMDNVFHGGSNGLGSEKAQIRYMEEIGAFRTNSKIAINVGGDLIVQGAKEIEQNRQTAWQRIAPAIDADFEVVDGSDDTERSIATLSGAPIVPDEPKRQAKPLTEDQMTRLRRRRMRNARGKRGVRDG